MKWQAQAALRQMQKEGGQEHEDPDRLYADEADDEGNPKPRGRGRGKGRGRGRGRCGTPRQPNTSRGAPKGDDAKGEKKNKDGEAQEEDAQADMGDQDDKEKDETTVDQTASDNKRPIVESGQTPKRKTRRAGAGFKKRSMSKSPAHPKKKVKTGKAAEAPNMDEDCK